MSVNRAPTMADVARAAGVSKSTVSRVFQPGSSVSAEAQIQVREAAADLGYVPNLVASELASGGGTQLGLLIRDATNSAYGHLHAAMNRAARRRGRSLVTVTAYGDDYGTVELEGLQRLIGLRVAGVFVATGVTAPEDLAAAASALPLMIVGRPNDDPSLTSVSYDERTHARMIVDRAHELGHRRIGVMQGPVMYSRVFDLRARSAFERCAELGIDARRIDLLPVVAGVQRAVEAVRSEDVTCIVCPVDSIAFALLRACADQRIRVPEDVSVTGFDGVSAGLDLIGLTTVRLPIDALADDAVARMDDLVGAGAEHVTAAPGSSPAGSFPPAARSLHMGELIEGRTLGPSPESIHRALPNGRSEEGTGPAS